MLLWMHNLILKMENSSQHFSKDLIINEPHSAIICGMTGCGKTVFMLELLQGPYNGVFNNIIIICPTIKWNKTYQNCCWVWNDPGAYIVDPGENLHEWLRYLFSVFQGEPTLYIIDDCSALKALTKKKDMLSELAFSGRHVKQSVWVLTQKYNSVLKDLREQTKWVALFHCKDKNSFNDCMDENNIIPADQVPMIKQKLAQTKHAKLVLKTDQPIAYKVL